MVRTELALSNASGSSHEFVGQQSDEHAAATATCSRP